MFNNIEIAKYIEANIDSLVEGKLKDGILKMCRENASPARIMCDIEQCCNLPEATKPFKGTEQELLHRITMKVETALDKTRERIQKDPVLYLPCPACGVIGQIEYISAGLHKAPAPFGVSKGKPVKKGENVICSCRKCGYLYPSQPIIDHMNKHLLRKSNSALRAPFEKAAKIIKNLGRYKEFKVFFDSLASLEKRNDSWTEKNLSYALVGRQDILDFQKDACKFLKRVLADPSVKGVDYIFQAFSQTKLVLVEEDANFRPFKNFCCLYEKPSGTQVLEAFSAYTYMPKAKKPWAHAGFKLELIGIPVFFSPFEVRINDNEKFIQPIETIPPKIAAQLLASMCELNKAFNGKSHFAVPLNPKKKRAHYGYMDPMVY